MQWKAYFVGRLEAAFDTVYLEGPNGTLYGAGAPVDAVELLRLSVGAEEMEHYGEVLVDAWAMFHVLDQAFGLDPLITFDFDDADENTFAVRYDVLDAESDRAFVSIKVGEEPLAFLAAADRTALSDLLSSLMLTLLGTSTVFGENHALGLLPSGIINARPDLLSQATIRKGMEMLVRRQQEDGAPNLRSMIEHVQRFGNPIFRDALVSDPTADAGASQRDMFDLYFESVYTESDPL